MVLDHDLSPLHPSSSSPADTSTDLDRSLAAYEYFLPTERIAQNPSVPRDSCRLLAIASPTHHLHSIFRDLPSFLRPGDLLVLNNTRVIPARLKARKSTGAPVEVLLLEQRDYNSWLALVKPGKRLKQGARIEFEPQGGEIPLSDSQSPIPYTLAATVVAADEATGGRILQFEMPEAASFGQLLEHFGVMPLPPYITASGASPEQYQTVYAQQPGAVAAPTAGLHFTDELLERLQDLGINRAFVTLHVGVGTFRPVFVEDVTTHKMHGEWAEVPVETVEKIRQTQQAGGRIIAVGTTVVRSLEGAATSGQIQPYCGQIDLFIYPGYQWRVVQGLITNFHLPRSSLLMLVSALVGRRRLLDLYEIAIAHQYSFYSFGDAMLILPEACVDFAHL